MELVVTLRTLGIRDVFNICASLRSKGKKVVDAHIGAPSHDPPVPLKKAVEEAMNRISDIGTSYKPFLGMAELREEIAKFHKRYLGQEVGPDQIFVTCGGAHALYLALKFFSGKKGLIPVPSFPHHFMQPETLGIKAVYYNPAAESLVEEVLAKLDGETSFVLVNYPHNPTGFYPNCDELLQLHEELKKRKIALINDVVYHEIYYEERPPFPGDILVNSFSKSFNLPGLRLGYVCWNYEGVEKAGKLVYMTTAGTSDLAQATVLVMLKKLTESYFEEVRKYYAEKRDLLDTAFSELDFQYPRPKGAFYFFLKHKKLQNSNELALRLLKEDRKACVGIVPGPAFRGGSNQFRVSFGKITREDAELMVEELKRELEGR